MISRFAKAVRRFVFEEDSPTAVEYAVMVALIAVAVIFGATKLGLETNEIFIGVAKMIEDLIKSAGKCCD